MRARLEMMVQVALAFLVMAGGWRFTRHLIETAPRVERAEPVKELPRVDYRVAVRETLPLEVRTHGTLKAARRVVLRPRLTSSVEWLSPHLVPGEVVREGEELVRLDRRDHELALRRAREALEQARKNLEIEEGRHNIARTEWDMFQGAREGSREGSPLALRLPQLASARSAVDVAASSVEAAELELSRTVIRAPFNSVVVRKATELGQLVTQQVDLVELVGIDHYWIELPLSPVQLSQLEVPGVDGG